MNEKLQEYGGILPCGGKGSRIALLTGDSMPKSLYKVNGKELMRYSIDILKPDLVPRLVFAVDYKAEQIIEWVNTNSFPHIIHFSEQVVPGILGSIVSGAKLVSEESIVACNTDEIRIGLNLKEMLAFHESNGTLATMAVTHANNLQRHRVINMRESDKRIVSTSLKPDEYIYQPEKIDIVNTGFLILNKRAIEYFNPEHSMDWGGIIDPLVDSGQLSAYLDSKIAYFNVGTVDEYTEAQNHLIQNSSEG